MSENNIRVAFLAAGATAVLTIFSPPAGAQVPTGSAAPVVDQVHVPGVVIIPAPAELGAVPGSTVAIMPEQTRAEILAYALATGDDDRNGVITDDESGWNCYVHGNTICGPDAAPFI